MVRGVDSDDMVMALVLELVLVRERWERWKVITWLHGKPVMSRAQLARKELHNFGYTNVTTRDVKLPVSTVEEITSF